MTFADILFQIWAYLWAVFGHWQSYATGGGVTAILLVFEKLYRPISKRVFRWIVLWTFLGVASFMAWRDEYIARPQLRGTIDTTSISENPVSLGMKGTLFSMIVSIRNTGTPTIVENYGLTIKTSDGEKIRPQLITIPELFLMSYPNGKIERVSGKDALYEKTTHQIETGGLTRGRLWFFSPQPKPAGLSEYELSFADVTGKRFVCTRKDDNSGPNTNLDFPGMAKRF